MTTTSSEVERIGRATRFAVASVLVGLSYFPIRASLNISSFESIFRDMLGANERLPALTVFVLQTRTLIIGLSITIPLVSIALLFTRDIVRSLYNLGFLALLAVGESILLFHALGSPLTKIITSMSTAPG